MARVNLKEALAKELGGIDGDNFDVVSRSLAMSCMLLGQGASKGHLPNDFVARVSQVVSLTGSDVPEVRVQATDIFLP
jgi:hypothetical protein